MDTGSPEPRFVADAMLGRLARWLRALGFDTRFEPALQDSGLVALARREGRVLLTRDRDLVVHLRPERALLLAPVDALAQLREVVQGCGLTPPFALFSRCLLCNAPLRAAEPAEVQAGVPERSRALPGPFLRCPDCGRLYWPGTHVQHMRACLAAALPGAIPAQSPPAPDAGGRGCSSPPFQR